MINESSRTSSPNKARLVCGAFLFVLIMIVMKARDSGVPFLLCFILAQIVAPELKKVKTTWRSMTLLFFSIIALMLLSFLIIYSLQNASLIHG
ncbi:MAG: hypothetical protein M3347_04670 [Armatimonadota bacterium]|nr:hypothetical protein [Armatimonadota bacterium]